MAAAATVRPCTAEEVDSTVQFVWHLRHRDTRAATDMARGLLSQDVERHLANPLTSSQRGWLCLVLAETSLLRGGIDECEGFLEEATSHFERAGSALGLCDVMFVRANVASDVGDYPTRDDCLGRALRAAEEVGDPQREIVGRLNQHMIDVLVDPRAATEAMRAEVSCHLNSVVPGVAFYANAFMCLVALSENNFAAGIEYGDASRLAAEEAGLLRRALAQASQVALAYIDLGDPAGAIQYLNKHLDFAKSTAWPQPLASVLSTLAYAMEDLGRVGAAVLLATEAVETLSRFPRSKNYLTALNALASLEFKVGRLDAAVEKYEAILNAESVADIIELRPYALLGLAQSHLASGAVAKAAVYAKQAGEFALERNDAPVRIDALRQLAAIAAKARDMQECAHAGLLEPLVYLREAKGLVQGWMQIEKADELLTELSRELAADGSFEEALSALQMAMDSRASISAAKAQKTAVVAEIKLKTARAVSEASKQRETAAAEAQRAAELEALNGQLRCAMEALQSTQHLLIRRNEELNAAYATISELSVTDPLTGLKNRRYFSQIVEADVARCIRGYVQSKFGDLDLTFGAPRTDLVFFLVDIDHFKSVNDQYGHSAGDAVLVELTKRLQQVVRAEDYVVRWGGEEFLVVSRGLARGLAAEMAERLRLSVSQAPFTLPDGLAIRKTCSIGFAVFPSDERCPERGGWQEAVEVADARLYQAKRAGRDRCIGSDPAESKDVAAEMRT
ncbi:GGDEF domain-containing protein [Ottowia sp.]|uniref:GGDEF domain-containing protein n=1 Tax=Ottowia sp. TaxID=1898956 RepID=UPI0025EF8251|nr:GGDEF domain-containing protein [Ottowia sp.]MBK6616587.1 GGDEF domain-containing protein [Ottowia sp.]